MRTTDLPLTVANHQDANKYVLNTPSRWLAVVQLNGELFSKEQEEVMRVFAQAPAMMQALKELLADPYLADPINKDRTAKSRAILAALRDLPDV
jgi:hypothetical protein